MPDALTFLTDLFRSIGFVDYPEYYARAALFVIVIILCIAADLAARFVLVRGFGVLARKTKNQLDDLIIEAKIFQRLAHLAPALILYSSSGVLFPEDDSKLQSFVSVVANAYMYLVVALCLMALLDALVRVYESSQAGAQIPVRGFARLINSAILLVAAILILSEFMGKQPWEILTGLGAMTAVVMLVFKDSILGFVASVQLATKDMVRVGDWIEFPSYGADGDVLSISLNTVKVQNWDKTISTIPTYAFISSSFKNWRGMSNSEGRRIKRRILIDMNSVKLCDAEMLEAFEKFELIREYVTERGKEIREHNEKSGVDMSLVINGRRLTNLGTFRRYVLEYLRNHPDIHLGMTLLVRQLQSTEHGVPIEVYCFSSDKVWANYESIQADIFDHIIAVIPEFGLRAYQRPAGSDVRSLLRNSSS